MKKSDFRKWVDSQYFEHCDEREAFRENPITAKEYWTNTKWFLKYKFKFVQMKNNE